MNKSKFETARDAAAYEYGENNSDSVMNIKIDLAFSKGADWGAAYERERAAKLVEALKEIKESTYQPYIGDFCLNVLNAYGSEK